MDFVLEMMKFVLEMMNLVLEMMKFVLEMMNVSERMRVSTARRNDLLFRIPLLLL